jgi:hypothetical protein
MAVLYLDNPPTLPPAVLQELDALVAKLNVWLAQEHNDQGGHTRITADSLLVDGRAEVETLRVGGPVYERGRAAPVGTWTDVPYSPGNFTAPGGSWGVEATDLNVYRAALVGTTMFFHLTMSGADVTGAPGELWVALPPGIAVGHYVAGLFAFDDAGSGRASGLYYANPNDTMLHLIKYAGAWTATTGGTSIFLTAVLEVIG